jgi:23S rRNA pseudouridine2605 synthase
VRGVNVDAVMRTLLARGLITEAGADPDTGRVTFATTELFLERLGLTSLTDLPDIAPLLPDVDVIDDLSETLGREPRFMKLSGCAAAERRCPSTWTKTEMAIAEGVRCRKCCRRPELRRARRREDDPRRPRRGRRPDGDRAGHPGGPDVSVIRVDGARVTVDDTLVHLAINKPRGMHSTMSDDRGRPCIGDLVEHRVRGNKKLFHVGRLDADTEGLMLLTNDGELAHRLMHPSFEVPKTYLATVDGSVPRGLGRKLRDGIELDDGPRTCRRFRVVDKCRARRWCG